MPHQTIRDVAHQAGVSPATVSRVINGSHRVSPKTARRVEKALHELGYVPTTWAPTMASADIPKLIGFVIPDVLNPFFPAIYTGLDFQARKHGFNVWMVGSGERPEYEADALRALQRYRAQGIVLTPTHPDTNLPFIERISAPICLVDRRLAVDAWDLVLIDNVLGARQATECLIEAGHKRIAIIAGPQTTTTGAERLLGYVQALTVHGLPVSDRYIKTGNFHQETGFALSLELLSLDNPPTAIFSCNNLMTMGVIQAIQAVPDMALGVDIAVVGFDDIPIAQLTDPPLTLVSRPMKEMGVQAVQLLLARIQAPTRPLQTVVLAPHLTVRGSERIRPTPR